MAGPAIAGLVLAAGESSRMGRDKALLPYHGRTFLEMVVAKLREAGISRVGVVLGHHAGEIRRAVSLPGVEVVTNCDYLRGQTSSLQAGLAALERLCWRETGAPSAPWALPKASVALSTQRARGREEPETLDAVILCLVDHPAFEPSTLTALIEAFVRTMAPVIVPTHGGRRGHPVLIARPLFKPLLALRTDQGANSVIRDWHSHTQFVEVADPGTLVDVDDPDTYSALDRSDSGAA